MFCESNLRACVLGVDAEYDSALFAKLCAAYCEPARHYHDRSHVSALLEQFEAVRDLAMHPREVELAIWFHDAIYDTRKNDNEERSAAWADEYLTTSGAPTDSITRIVEMILATKSHRGENLDACIMLDIDLGILGAPWPEFERYDAAIRREYAWVPEQAYRQGRLDVLTRFYERARIFTTDHFHERLEAAAHDNLRAKIADLSQ